MEELKSHTITPISAIPGLYISDIHVARTPSLLKAHGISHVLSVTRKPFAPRYTPSDGILSHLVVEIDDDPLEDLVGRLEESCDWIDGALSTNLVPGPMNAHVDNSDECEGMGEKEIKEGDAIQSATTSYPDAESRGNRGGRVLIHCLQGISRSGAVVTAFLMRRLSLDYDAALEMARRDRDLITPNMGFVEQLRLWHTLNYEHLKEDGTEKQGYTEWRKKRDGLAKGSDEVRNRERAKGMASLAARFGARRLKWSEDMEGR
ncbi:protein-tyrosine phosphatase-like protein [Clohesyomyces aquaticus]|uniref:protein-tyrosine-phosphatase n=1 Tax=Clohesyomyces aquaticus TaxID=1231657 RepID=A0A1Y2A3H8_9PLEO|nr:protein-tyrosine phosphatase-like protein [Clohesyomyces aquaticus]